MNRIRSLSSVSKASRVLVAFLAGIALYAVQSAPVFANASIGMASKFPLSTIVGATNVAAFLDFQNVSAPASQTITVNAISLTPSCAAYTGLTCTTPDNGVFAVSSTGTGRSNSACAGVSFTFTPRAGSVTGQLDVTPMTTIVLGVPGSPNMGDECIIDFTFDVLKAPAIDALTDGGHPGWQTLPSGQVTGTASDSSLALGFGTTFITVNQALPAIATVASSSVLAGNTIYDAATLSAGVNPTGSITFYLYGPNDASCSTSIFSSTVAVSGNGNYVSGAFTAAAAGTYRWIASYSGDGSNSAVAGTCNAASESVIVTVATPTIATTASASINLGATINDTATLAGGSAPTGFITFNLYGPGDATCSTTAVFTSMVAVNGNGNYASTSFTPVATGTYRWVASYGGDASNAAVAGACGDSNESVAVTQATPAIATVASADITIGGSVTDTAALTGTVAGTGSITFTLYGPNDATCSAAPVFTSNAISVSGNGSYTSAPAFTPTAAGTYRWRASYTGDTNNQAVAGVCNAANESVAVSKAGPTIATLASTGGAVGTTLTDTATLAGGSNPTGTIIFTLYGPNDATCTTAIFTSSPVAVAGNGSYSPSSGFAPTAAGVYRWRAAYSGDANNNAVTGACNAAGESATIDKSSPAIATLASAGGALGSASLTDTAQLTAGSNPTGTITFTLYGPNDATCATVAFTSNAVSVSGNGSYTSTPAFTPTAIGTYRWRAAYSGDANNNAISGACNDANESVVISQATPAIATTASAGGAVGTSLTDHATLSGGSSPTGSITFRLYGPNDATCGNAPVFTSSAVAVNGNGGYTSTPAFTTTATGTYRWRASYSGDAGNAAVAGACNDTGENVTIATVTPTLATSASAGVKLGNSIGDTATLAGGLNPTGTITFRAYGPNDASCSIAVYTSNAVTVSGNATYASTPAFTPTAVGTYRFIATYSGDANNASLVGACGDSGESVVVSTATPAIVTSAAPGGLIGTSLSDQATLSGGVNPTGTITFTLYGPNDATCSTTPVFTSAAVSVTGNGTYPSGAFVPTTGGTYRWRAAYSGDTANAAISGACNDANESATITGSSPTLVTQTSASVNLGASIHDTATLAGGTTPTGAIMFKLYGPNDATCANPAIFTTQATITGNGSYVSPNFTPNTVGTYRWVASYAGDANNVAISAACNDANENVVVQSPPPPIVHNVPTLSHWALMLLSLMLAAVASAGFAVRRRQR